MGLQLCAQRVSGVTVDGLQALYCFRLEVGLEVWDRSANQPAGSLGDLGQSSLVLFLRPPKWQRLLNVTTDSTVDL